MSHGQHGCLIRVSRCSDVFSGRPGLMAIIPIGLVGNVEFACDE